MGDEVTMRALASLLGVSKQIISELAKRGIIVRGAKRGTYDLSRKTGPPLQSRPLWPSSSRTCLARK